MLDNAINFLKGASSLWIFKIW